MWGQPPPAVRRSEALQGFGQCVMLKGKTQASFARLDSRGGCPNITF